MKILHLEVTTRCNLRCRHCRVRLPGWMSNEIIPLAAAARAFAYAATWPDGAYCILQGHGEPLVHPDYPALFAQACAACWRGVEFQTNGLLLRPAVSEALLAAAQGRWRRLKVSLDGPDAETNQAMRPGACWGCIMDNLAYLAAQSVHPALTVECVITKLNLAAIAAMPRFARELGADRLQLSPFSSWPGAEELAPTSEELAAAIAAAMANRPAGMNVEIPAHCAARELCPPAACAEPREVLFVAVDGAIYPCCRLRQPLGNLTTQEIAEVLNGAPRAQFIAGMATHEICATCPARRARV